MWPLVHAATQTIIKHLYTSITNEHNHCQMLSLCRICTLQQVLVDLIGSSKTMDTDVHAKALVHIGIDGILRVFSLQVLHYHLPLTCGKAHHCSVH
jgi:hypothetical protein